MALVRDTACPHSRSIVKIDGRVVAISNNGVRGSRINSPLNWTTETGDEGNQALFVNTAQHAEGEPPVALGVHDRNLAVISRNHLQLWRTDPDPTLWELSDTLPVGTRYPYSLVNVSGNLMFLSPSGFRSAGYQREYENLREIDLGSPIDELVRDRVFDNVRATYSVKYGQYLCLCSDSEGDQIFVMTFSQTAGFIGWSRYTIDGGNHGRMRDIFTVGDDDIALLLESDDGVQSVAVFDEAEYSDFGAQIQAAARTIRNDYGRDAYDKRFDLFEVVSEGGADYFIGDEADNEHHIGLVEGDSRPGGRLPINRAFVSPYIKIEHNGIERYNLLSMAVDYMNLRMS